MPSLRPPEDHQEDRPERRVPLSEHLAAEINALEAMLAAGSEGGPEHEPPTAADAPPEAPPEPPTAAPRPSNP